jgi:hypothetical protein
LKIKITIFFSILFIATITAPAIISLVNKNQDISIFFSLNEEEEVNFEIESFKDVKVCSNPHSLVFLKKNQKRKTVRFTSKNYSSVFLKITTPPPKLVF